MVFQATQNNQTELEELSVERDVEADGYVVGFEDAGGSFVEVGRLENVADNVSQPLEIKHQNSGERVTVDNSGLKTKKIDDDRLYAGAFSGSDPDSRLTNALSAATDGDCIFLESKTYSANRTVGKNITLVGTSPQISGTQFAASLTFDGRVVLRQLRSGSAFDLTLNGADSMIRDCIFFSTGSPTVKINADRCSFISSGRDVDIVFASTSNGGMVDACFGQPAVTDNGANIIGDI
jgi:hypothetical protein